MKYPYYFWSEMTLPWLKCAGANDKHTLVLSTESDAVANLPFLKKILRAADLDFDQDIHFVPTPENIETLLMADPHIENYRALVLFGIRPSQMGIWDCDKPGSVVFHFEKLACVSAPSLTDIERLPEFKKPLWSALKQIFSAS